MPWPGSGHDAAASCSPRSGHWPACVAPAARNSSVSSAPRSPRRSSTTSLGFSPGAVAPAPRTLDPGPWTLDSGLWTLDSGPRGIFKCLSLESVIPAFIILVASLSFHEAAHAWTANRLGDPTARLLGRLTLNPLAHIDWIGTVLFPLVGMLSGLPLIGWAKPVPVNMNNLAAPRRDFAIVALAGPVSNV